MSRVVFRSCVQLPAIRLGFSRSCLPQPCRQLATSMIIAVLIFGICIPLEAQTAHFAGVETVVASKGLSYPHQVAVDSSGNVYVADVGNDRILKETLTGTGYQESVVASTGLKTPAGVAVDSSGDVFVADSGNNRVLEEELIKGVFTQIAIPITGLNTPLSIAVDGNGNLYIADWGNARVVKETLIGSNYSQSLVVVGPNPDGIAVDASGNVYVCAPGYNQLLEMSPSGSGYSLSYVGSGLSQPHGVTTDRTGILYVVDSGNSRIVEEVPNGAAYSQSVVLSTGTMQPQAIASDVNGNLYFSDPTSGSVLKLAHSVANLGTSPIGTATVATSLIFSFDSSGSIASPSVVTQGIAGKDFLDAGTGSCTTSGTAHVYQPGDTCTVDVVFDPLRPGPRVGAALLASGAGQTIATGYLQGVGSGSALSYGSQSPISPSLPNQPHPWALAADGFGNLYIAQTDGNTCSPDCPVFKETWNGSVFVQSVIATGFQTPWGIAVDGAGNVYVADEVAFIIWKLTLQPDGTYTKSFFDSEGSARLVATDGAGNVYIEMPTSGVKIDFAEGGYLTSTFVDVSPEMFAESMAVDFNGNLYVQGLNGLFRIAPASGGFAQTNLSSLDLSNIAVDSMGNLYGTNESSLLKATPSGATYAQSTLATISGTLTSLTVDGSGNVFFSSGTTNIGYGGATSVNEIPFSLPPALHFAATDVGQTSTDSPRTLTIENSGNAPLIFPIPEMGSNPVLPSGFTLGESSTCPALSPSDPTAGMLSAGTSCNLYVSFSPQLDTDTSGWMILTDDALNAPAPAYATQSIALSVVGAPLTPTLTWATPASIAYGTPLGAQQLNAMANIVGTFSYSPNLGTVLGVGSHTLTATFTPVDKVALQVASTSVTLVVEQATPSITWVAPAAITYGTPLSSTQLTASTPVAGTFTYTPSAGTVLSAGSQTLSVTFTPTDTIDYTTATATVPLTVNQATPAITWATPAAITYGTALSATQLNASSPAAGTFSYSPAAASVLPAGMQTLTVTFTPNDSVDYTQATTSVTLAVNQANPAITWTPPAAITYGTALSAAQLRASSPVAGTFSYSPAAGMVLKAGVQTLYATFTPSDSVDYTHGTASVVLTVNQARPKITWATPVASPYGTKLSGSELDASATNPIDGVRVAGAFDYTPTAGALLAAGTHELLAIFTPTDTTDYLGASGKTLLTVTKARQTIDFTAPETPIVYGAKPVVLSAKATSKLRVTFTVVTGPGTVADGILTITGAGTIEVAAHQVGNDDYDAAPEVIHTIVVDKAKLTVSANDLTMKKGRTVPPLTYKMTGFANYDRENSATTGSPRLTTKATSSSNPGEYPITITGGTLESRNYDFKFVNGTLTVVE